MIRVSYDLQEFDLPMITGFIQTSYWGEGRAAEDIAQALQNSYCVGLFDQKETQVGFARATSDTLFHAFIFDLFIVEAHRGKGLSRQLITALMQHPRLLSVRTWLLGTRDAHGLYRKHGFEDIVPGRFMRLSRDNIARCPPAKT